jgi:16S rRNA (cytosine1402-N4)-methyltransferase
VYEHAPVLVHEVVEWLSPALSSGGVIVDCTVGGGGHAAALLEAAPGLRLVGIDRDDEALEASGRRLGGYGDRVRLVKANFAELGAVIGGDQAGAVEGVLYDLGVSSPQLDRAHRGFRYRGDAPLDMRMDVSGDLTAADVVNGYSETELARVIATYGEERFARRIAGAIVARRAQRKFEGTEDLADVVKGAVPAAARRSGPHPARRTFQAVRIEVNNEIENLERSLPEALQVLKPGGRVAAISYHSLEDRVVKRFFASEARGCRCPRDLPVCVCGRKASVRVLTRKAIRPSDEEKRRNPRSDSARLRVAAKLEPPDPEAA